MIIPQFKLKQNQRCIEVFIRVPYIKVTSCEFYIESNTFKFYLKPYLLSLSFQQKLKQCQQPLKATYYHQKYILEVHLEKQTHGEHFKNLQLISNVINKKKDKKKNGKVLVQVVEGQQAIIESVQNKIKNEFNYGFELNYSNVLDNLEEQMMELFAFNPKDTEHSKRYSLSRSIITSQFDPDSYLFDKYENTEEIQYLLKDKTFQKYIEQLAIQQNGIQINSFEFKQKMKQNTKQLLISSKINVNKQIISIVFSYLYELICMNGQFGPQSAKTINKTSLIFNSNYLYENQDERQILIDCYRRCITYSLYKNINLCRYIHKYLNRYLSKIYTKVILNDLRKLFDQNQPRYLLNRIYVEDYLLYITSNHQQNIFQQQSKKIQLVNITENDLQLAISQYQKQDDITEREQEQIQKQKKLLIEEIEKLQTLD